MIFKQKSTSERRLKMATFEKELEARFVAARSLIFVLLELPCARYEVNVDKKNPRDAGSGEIHQRCGVHCEWT